MNVGLFWETSVGFLKSAVCVKVMSIWISKIAQNSTAFKKYMSWFSNIHLNVTSTTIEELSNRLRMALINFMVLVVLKIFDNLRYIQTSLKANKYWRKQSFKNYPVWPLF